MERLLTYGLSDSGLKHISEVENGLACNCTCANCGQSLIAKNNPTNKKAAHFAHQSDKECKGAFETAIHLLAKTIFAKKKCLTIPDYHFDYNPKNKKSLFKIGTKIIFDTVLLEQQITVDNEKIIPDAIGIIKGKQIFIEFANSHFIESDKKTKIKKLNIACIEIDLAGQSLDENSITTLLNSKTELKYWISNPRQDKKYIEQQNKNVTAEKKRKQEATKKYFQYKNDKQYYITEYRNNEVVNCPKKTTALNILKQSHFYRHKILKSIIDGNYWNGEIYGRIPNGRWIFINKEKITIFHPNLTRKEWTEQQRRDSKVFYAGLNTIQKTLNNPEFGDCVNCKLYIDRIYIDKNTYQICENTDK